jgi:isoleucyl-tRNA synthetase
VEKTALAEAEVEYEDITSTQIDVAFEIVESQVPELVGAYAVIWTTTPWTIPTNQALAYGADVEYVLVEIKGVARDGAQMSPHIGKRVIVADALFADFSRRIGNIEFDDGIAPRLRFKGSDLAGTMVRHPMAAAFPDSPFYTRLRPMLDGSDFVTTESGTGLVHMAPDHGEDDFALCKAHHIDPVFAVGADGVYRDDWPWLGAHDVDEEGKGRRRAVINPNFNAPDGPICEDLKQAGALLSASTDYHHSYPHSWRSKKKVIFRCTPQWFVPMDKPIDRQTPLCANEAEIRAAQGSGETLRQTALKAIADTRWVPEKGRNRIGSMVEGRPDWVLSRQRAWGVPITLFVERKGGQYLCDPAVNSRIVAAIREQGVDAWSDARAQEYLGSDYKAEDYERVTDILDVWFDSGSTHAFVLESGKWPDLMRPEGHTGPLADLYLEGSDQHRGWFQSSLLESCATRGHAPYKAVLTHGFTMDASGKKMSKSLGNTVDPIKVMETNGADIIRLWALSVDYTEDHRIGDEILKGVADQYRKIRNTFRYLLGALADFDEAERVPVAEMPELERYILNQLFHLDQHLEDAIEAFDFNTYVRLISDFCNEDLSAFFFDVRKDSLYCDAPSDLKRRAYRTVLDTLFHALVRYVAPVLVFTAEEVWGTRFPTRGSVHLLEREKLSNEWLDGNLASKFDRLRALREGVNETIEPLRREKTVRSSLEAEIALGADVETHSFSDEDLEELFITATVTRGQGNGVSVTPTTHHKCGRCWRHLPEVTEDGALCSRCDHVIAAMDATA